MERKRISAFSVVGLILGICSVILSLIVWTIFVGFLVGVAGIAFAALGRGKDQSRVAVGGLVISIIGALLFFGWILFPTLMSYIIMPFLLAGKP